MFLLISTAVSTQVPHCFSHSRTTCTDYCSSATNFNNSRAFWLLHLATASKLAAKGSCQSKGGILLDFPEKCRLFYYISIKSGPTFNLRQHPCSALPAS